ncbi:MAG: nucleoside-diphosphate sugar epimerase/dehydratase [Clostridiales bacterium]|nr:nucleoside-diphosphate sugar epimerase/dehydratase [Clostridiales bacterium]
MFTNINPRKILLALIDAAMIFASFLVSSLLLNGLGLITQSFREGFLSLVVLLASMMIFMIALRVYSNIWRYAQIKDFLKCFIGATMGFLAAYFICDLAGLRHSDVVLAFAYLISICSIVVSRTIYSWLFELIKYKSKSKEEKIPTLIVGAGMAGHRIISEMREFTCSYLPIAIVDDDSQKQNTYVRGVKVMGRTRDIPKICRERNISTILVAIPSVDTKERQRILDICSTTQCTVKTLPYVHEIIDFEDLMSQTQDIKIEDLLGREVITFDNQNVMQFIENKICMVTGGGGSIGSELCRHIAKYDPKKLIIVDISENGAYDIQQELLRQFGSALNLEVEIASVRDYAKMDLLFSTYRPDLVFHAAAHKHVPLMETNPEEAVKNNIVGTYNVATLSDFYKVQRFVLISTDKAVNPTNVMGASKRCCEMIIQEMGRHSKHTAFIAVRFGNVLGSNGSVIPLFEKQLAAGGPLTVTHPDIIRYFMTIPEAVSLILQAASGAQGGEIFVLDMGEPVKIVTLAENLIKLHGKTPYKDIDIVFTGLRPGEKLFEELLMDEEGLRKTDNKKIFIGSPIEINEEVFLKQLDKLKSIALSNDKASVVELLKKIVPTFTHK